MSLARSDRGFTAIEAILLLIIVLAVGLVGYKVYNTKNTTDKINNETAAVSNQPTSSSVSGIPAINSKSDLDKAEQALDQNDPTADNNSDLSQLDKELGSF